MRRLLIPVALITIFGGSPPGLASDDFSSVQIAEAARKYGLDQALPLESRVRETSPAVLKLFEESGAVRPTVHTLTKEEQRKLSSAFAAIPPIYRQILRDRMRSFSFLDGMPNTALTSTVNPEEPYRLFDITIRAAILHQNASQWLTEKERSCFDAAGSTLSLSIEAGKHDAILYLLLHEASHIVDNCLGISPSGLTSDQPVAPPPSAFTDGVWSERIVPAPVYRDPQRQRIHFYVGGEKLNIAQAVAVYESLRRTPFASLYGSTNWHDDFAEYLSIYHWTQKIKQPFRIVIRDKGRAIFSYEPMKSKLVRERAGQMERFYISPATTPAIH